MTDPEAEVGPADEEPSPTEVERAPEEAPSPPASRPSADGPSPPKPAAARAPAKRRAPWWLALVALVAVAIGLFAGARYFSLADPQALEPAPARAQLLDAAPSGATLLATADVRALRASPLVGPYLAGDRSVEGLGKLREACGVDPLSMVDEVALVVPDSPDSDFGVVAIGGFADQAVLECAAKIVTARGGKPVASSIGSFRTVRDAAGGSLGEVAARPGLLILGGGAYLRSMIDTADGRLPSAKADPLHAELGVALAEFATVRVTLVLSSRQRATIGEEIGASAGRAPRALAAVKAAGVGLRLAGDRAQLLAVVRCDDAASAIEIASMLTERKASFAATPAAVVLGAAPLVERMQLSVEGADVRIALDVGVAEIEQVLDRALELRAAMEARAPSPEPPSSAAPRPSAAGSATPSAPASSAP
jgi:hypothetical protein